MSTTSEKIIEVLAQRFPDAAGLALGEFSMQSIADWDSMAHVEIVVTLERLFGIEADAALVEAQSAGELVAAVDALLTGGGVG